MKTRLTPPVAAALRARAPLCLFAFGAFVPGLLFGQTPAVTPAIAETVKDDVVRLDAFEVKTSLGHYTDTTSDSAMKVSIPQIDLPFTVQGLNAAFLTDVRTSRLEDAFGYITGLNKQGEAANQFTLRGFTAAGSNLQSLQIDGLPGPTSRFASPPTINVERLEVLKGPTSVLYGQANPGGLLNVVTKSPQAARRTTVSTFASTYAGQTSAFGDANSYTTSLDTTGAIDTGKHWLYRLILSYEDQRSFRDYYYQRNKYLYPSLTYKLNADTSVTIKGDYVREQRQANDGLAVPFLNAALLPPINVAYTAPDAKDTDYGESVTTTFQTRLLDRWTARASYRATYHTDTRTALEVAQQAITSNATDYTLSTIARRLRVQENVKRYNVIDANISGAIGPESLKHTLIAGVNGGKEWLDTATLAQGGTIPALSNISLYTSVPDVPAVPTYSTAFTAAGLTAQRRRQTPFWNYGFYASDQVKVGQYFDASLGVRSDRQDSYQKTTSLATGATSGLKQNVSKILPSAGLVFHPVSDLSLYASYCEGFKPQAPGNVDANDNSNFSPETASQVEVGLKADAFNHKLTGGVSVYDIKKKNVLTAAGGNAPSGNPIANLSGLQESKGVEVNVAYQPLPHWQVQVGYTYIDARVKTSATVILPGALLDNTPHNAGNLWTRYNFPHGRFKGLGFGYGFIYAGTRQAIITNVPTTITINPTTKAVTATGRLELPGYARSDLGVYYKHGRFDYALNVANVFDRTYLSGAIPGEASRLKPGDPRKLTFSVRFDL
jgi:iron complex outermembrane receptor protein